MTIYANGSELEYPLIQSSTYMYLRLYTGASSLVNIHYGELFANQHLTYVKLYSEYVKLYSENTPALLYVYNVKPAVKLSNPIPYNCLHL